MTRKYNRRTFIEFLGKGTLGVTLAPGLLSACSDQPSSPGIAPGASDKFPFQPILPTEVDRVVLADGFNYEILIKWGDPISETDKFGFNNDFIQFLPDAENKDEALLWVNHEYVDSTFVIDEIGPEGRTKEQVEAEMYEVGGSILKLIKKKKRWSVVEDDEANKRVTGLTMLPFKWDEPVEGATAGMGTLGNCSGGMTPWGTILTCEENYDGFYGETLFDENGAPYHEPSSHEWEKFYPENKPEHYGWVVEIDPKTGEGEKLVALGRCMHECAMLKELQDGRVVVYTGDDSEDRCLYKFVSSKPGSLKEGELFVANLEENKWISLDYNKQPILQEKYSGQTEVQVRLRDASLLVGGSQLNRPEDIEIDPLTGAVLVALTNNVSKDDYFGRILKIEESDGYDGLTFKHDTFLAGGEDTGFACPDNMAFDPKGNLWFTSDMSGSVMGQEPYTNFKNNGLFFVPRTGKRAGDVLQVASAPTHAEFTGPCFSPDGSTLFLSVQHPGEYSESIDNLSSHWPEGGNAVPKPSVITITGPALDAIIRGEV